MAISISTDLVSDVLRAAEPARLKKAKTRLAQAGGFEAAVKTADRGAATVRSLETDLVDGVLKAADPARARRGEERLAGLDAGDAGWFPAAAAGPAALWPSISPEQQMEAFLLGRTLEALLPKEGSGFFGADAGAGIWRSLLADRLGGEMARSADLGIAQLLEKAHEDEQV